MVIDRLVENGYNVTDVLDIIIRALIYNKDISEAKRVFMIEETIKVVCVNEQCSSLVHLYKLAVSAISNFL
jgi:hypothetical protein